MVRMRLTLEKQQEKEDARVAEWIGPIFCESEMVGRQRRSSRFASVHIVEDLGMMGV